MGQAIGDLDHRDGIETAARLGYLARALVFLVIGYFAFRSAFGGGEAMSEEDAILQLVGSPFGTLMLVLLVLALPSFALWRFLQSIFDADGYGTELKGIAVRIGRFISGGLYLFLGIYAGSLLFGLRSGNEGEGGGQSSVLDAWAPVFGPWFTIPVALILIAVSLDHVKKAWTGEFLRFLALPSAHAGWMTALCRIGLVARSMVFAALAVLFFTSVSRWDTQDTPGIQDALHEIGTWPFGGLLLSATGAGLIAFAAYGLLLARYGHIRAPDLDPSGGGKTSKSSAR